MPLWSFIFGVKTTLTTYNLLQHGAIQISPNKVGHLSVVQNSQRDSRPYAILPGGNFHPAQTASTKTPPVPDLKYHEQHQQVRPI